MSHVTLKKERRQHPRAITSFSGLLTAGNAQFHVRIVNLSMGGALLDFSSNQPQQAIAVGDSVTLEIRCRGGGGPVTAAGTAVLWNESLSKVPVLAVQFQELTEEPAELMEELLFDALSTLHQRHLESAGR